MWIVQPWVLFGQFLRHCRNESIMLLHFEFEIKWLFWRCFNMPLGTKWANSKKGFLRGTEYSHERCKLAFHV